MEATKLVEALKKGETPRRLTETTFDYKKKDGTDTEEDVLVLDTDSTGVSGISLKYLSEDEAAELLGAVEKLDLLVSENMKYYRKYLYTGVKI